MKTDVLVHKKYSRRNRQMTLLTHTSKKIIIKNANSVYDKNIIRRWEIGHLKKNTSQLGEKNNTIPDERQSTRLNFDS